MPRSEERRLALSCNHQLGRFVTLVHSEDFVFENLISVESLADVLVGMLPLFWQIAPDYQYEMRSESLAFSVDRMIAFPLEEDLFTETVSRIVAAEVGSLEYASPDPLFLEHIWSALAELAVVASFVSKCVESEDFEGALAEISLYFWVLYGPGFIGSIHLAWILVRIFRVA